MQVLLDLEPYRILKNDAVSGLPSVRFGLVPSPFLLGRVIECHLETWERRMPELAAELHKNLYVDDLISWKPTVREARELNEGAISIFVDAKFKLRKWHSNVAELEEPEGLVADGSTFAKQQLGSPRAKNGSLLGLPWDKQEDQIGLVLPRDVEAASKRASLHNLARIYDPLGLVAPLLSKESSSIEMPATRKSPGMHHYHNSERAFGHYGIQAHQLKPK